jgi:DNA repair ATPase RecN
MNGSLIKVERESRKWKEKFEEASQTLQSLVTQKKTADQTLAQKQRQLDKLEQLCRKLTEERTALIKQLKETSD